MAYFVTQLLLVCKLTLKKTYVKKHECALKKNKHPPRNSFYIISTTSKFDALLRYAA
jgi:hypothetical protein